MAPITILGSGFRQWPSPLTLNLTYEEGRSLKDLYSYWDYHRANNDEWLE
jgi:hypothetical protein